MQIQDVQAVDAGLLLLVVALAGQDIVIQHAVGEAKLVLIAHAAESVRRSLPDQLLRQTQDSPDLKDLMHQKVRKRTEIAGCVAVLGRIADIILGSVAGVDNTAAVGQILRDRVQSCHADPGRQIDLGFARHLSPAADLLKLRILLQSFFQRVSRCPDVDLHIGNLQRVDQKLTVGNIRLHTARHQDAHDTVFSQSLGAQSRRDAGVLAARNADDCAAGRSVRREIVADPLYDLIFCLFRIFQHNDLLFNIIPIQYYLYNTSFFKNQYTTIPLIFRYSL